MTIELAKWAIGLLIAALLATVGGLWSIARQLGALTQAVNDVRESVRDSINKLGERLEQIEIRLAHHDRSIAVLETNAHPPQCMRHSDGQGGVSNP